MVLPEYYRLFCPKMASWKIIVGGGGGGRLKLPSPPASYVYESTWLLTASVTMHNNQYLRNVGKIKWMRTFSKWLGSNWQNSLRWWKENQSTGLLTRDLTAFEGGSVGGERPKDCGWSIAAQTSLTPRVCFGNGSQELRGGGKVTAGHWCMEVLPYRLWALAGQ